MDEVKIANLMGVASKVLFAMEAIGGEWTPKVQAAMDLPYEERLQVLNNYLRAIAIEMLKKEEGD